MKEKASAGARITLFAKWMVGVMLVSAPISLILANPLTAAGAATTSTSSSSTSSATFLVSTDRPNYTGSDAIVVSGIAPPASAVTITISNPLNAAVASTPATIAQDNSFRATFQAGGAAWSMSGKYTVVVVLQTPDTVAAPPRTNSTFLYTAVATATTGQTSSAVSSSSNVQGVDTSTLASIAGIVAVVVVALALVGFLLRSRGRRQPVRPG